MAASTKKELTDYRSPHYWKDLADKLGNKTYSFTDTDKFTEFTLMFKGVDIDEKSKEITILGKKGLFRLGMSVIPPRCFEKHMEGSKNSVFITIGGGIMPAFSVRLYKNHSNPFGVEAYYYKGTEWFAVTA